MAEQTMDSAALGLDGGAKRGGGKKMLLLVALPLLLLAAVGGGLYATGIVGGAGAAAGGDAATEASAAAAPAPTRPATFLDLPELLVNLNTKGKRTVFLKLHVSLEIDDPKVVDRLTALSPRIIDNFQVYLREMRPEDLQGSAGMARLREELRRRVNAAVEPITIRDVLFREILVQ